MAPNSRTVAPGSPLTAVPAGADARPKYCAATNGMLNSARRALASAAASSRPGSARIASMAPAQRSAGSAAPQQHAGLAHRLGHAADPAG